MNDSNDDYLWDGSSPPDPEIEALEEMLADQRYAGSAPALPRRRWPWMVAVAAAVLIAVGAAIFLQPDHPGPAAGGWSYRLATGAEGTLGVGEWLETGSETADVFVADIGQVTLDPESRLKLLATGTDQHRVHLAQGRMHAVVDAPPELFITDTPAATAVDMGCAYELFVGDAGDGYLHVTLGRVELRREGRRSVVPADARCEARAQQGLGTPHFLTASSPLRVGLRQIDFEKGGSDALGMVLESAGSRDTLTLWHLLQRPRFAGEDRELILDALESFTEMPIEATRDGTLALDPAMLDAWYWKLDLLW